MNEVDQNISLKQLPVWATFREAVEFWQNHWATLQRGVLLGSFLGGLQLWLDEFSPFPGSQKDLHEVFSVLLSFIQLSLFLVSIEVFVSLAISCYCLMLMRNTNDQYAKLFIDWIRESRMLSFFFGNFTSEKLSRYGIKQINFGCFILLVYIGAWLVLFFGQLIVGLFIEN